MPAQLSPAQLWNGIYGMETVCVAVAVAIDRVKQCELCNHIGCTNAGEICGLDVRRSRSSDVCAYTVGTIKGNLWLGILAFIISSQVIMKAISPHVYSTVPSPSY